MVLYYTPYSSMSMFSSTSGTGGSTIHHRHHHQSSTIAAASATATAFNFPPSGASPTPLTQNNYSPYTPNCATPTTTDANSLIGNASIIGSALSGSPPSSHYPLSEMPAGLPHPGMPGDILLGQTQGMPPGHHATSWHTIPPPPTSVQQSIRGPGSMIAVSPFDDWPGQSGSPMSSGSPCISGSPVNALPPCPYAATMSMPAPYGQPLQVGAYHPHPSAYRSDHYPDPHSIHAHHHYHPHPHANSAAGLMQPSGAMVHHGGTNGGGGTTPVHPSPDSGLTISSDGVSGPESPASHQQAASNGVGTPGANGLEVKLENSNNGAISNRPQPARSPYEWMKKPSYQNQPHPGKTRTKDKYRVVYSDHQRLELEKEFHYSRYITIRRKSELAMMLGLSERQVKIWFQNRRAKERKQAKKRDEMTRKEKDHHAHHAVANLHPHQQIHPLHSLLP